MNANLANSIQLDTPIVDDKEENCDSSATIVQEPLVCQINRGTVVNQTIQHYTSSSPSLLDKPEIKDRFDEIKKVRTKSAKGPVTNMR